MHQYLKAIGFENIQTRKDLKKLLKDVEENFTHQTIVSYRPGEDFCEFQKEFGQDVGITLCGELDDEEHFELHIISHILREAELQLMQKSMCRERLRKNSMLVFVRIPRLESV
jgi:hypothetical protein